MHVARCLAQLPVAWAEALTLVYVEGYTYQQASVALVISFPTHPAERYLKRENPTRDFHCWIVMSDSRPKVPVNGSGRLFIGFRYLCAFKPV
jgi:hypothetical protein